MLQLGCLLTNSSMVWNAEAPLNWPIQVDQKLEELDLLHKLDQKLGELDLLHELDQKLEELDQLHELDQN